MNSNDEDVVGLAGRHRIILLEEDATVAAVWAADTLPREASRCECDACGGHFALDTIERAQDRGPDE
jgi:hypothetical protein